MVTGKKYRLPGHTILKPNTKHHGHPYTKSNRYSPGRSGISSFDYNSHKFVFKKGTKVEIAKFDFTEGNISDFGYGGNDQRVYKIGYTEYDQYKEDPNYDRALSDLLTFAQIMPDDSVYEEGKKIYLTHVQQVKDFWIKNEPKFKNLDRLSTIYEKAKGS